MKGRRVLVFDSDVYAVAAASVAQHNVCWDGDNCFPIASLSEAKAHCTDSILRIVDLLDADDFVLAMSHPDGYFRHDIYPQYKSNRKPDAKPVCLSPLKEWMAEEFTTYMRPKLEADDIMGILATSTKIIKAEEVVVVSVDKDMKTFPGLLYNPQIGGAEPELISEEEAAYWHMYQTLCGDTVDGYIGCRGVGPVAAEKLLDGLTGYEELWPVVLEAFLKKGKASEEEAILMARLARICQVSDYNFKKKEVKLWTPPSV